jgi:uncharacterized membrane protein
MKLSYICCLAALIAVPQQFAATPPLPPPVLGQLEASVSFCIQVDTKFADKYKELGKKLVVDISEKEVAEARASAGYKEGFNTMTAQLKELPKEKAVDACRASLRESTK